MSDPYEAFIESRLAAGETDEQVQQRIKEAFLPTAELCHFCKSREATLLCDFPIGYEWRGDYVSQSCKVRVATLESETFSCDRRICRECATAKPAMFVCRISDDGSDIANPEDCDSEDYCPACQKRTHLLQGKMKVLTKEDANALRLQMWNGSYEAFKLG